MFKQAEQRRRQIDTLKVFNDNVFEIQNDEKYGITFMSGSNEIKLIVELCSEFPYATPKIFLQPALVHPWIEGPGEVKHFPGLLNFTINSDLGRVCQAIIREFEKNPAELASDVPTVPVLTQSTIPALDGLDPSQLLTLLNDDQCMDDFIEELSPLKVLNAELDTLIDDTEKLAKENLEKNDSLQALKSSVQTLSTDFLNLGTHYSQKSRKYQEKSDEFLPENIRQMLEIGVANAESECDETVEKFLEGNQSLPEFLENFMKVKKLIATRKFKEDRLNFQLNQLKL